MREFLKGLDLDDEMIDCIMAEHGKLMTKNVEKINNLTADYNNLQSQYNELANDHSYESYKTELEDLEKKYNSLNNEYTNFQHITKVKEANVNPEFSEFVANKVNEMVTDDKTYEDALNEYLEQNKQYVKADTSKQYMKVGSSVNLNGGTQTPSTPNNVFNDLILKATGRK